MNIILGISAYFHDSAAAILIDGKIVAAVQEERFNREKNTAVFPENAIRYCLEAAGISLHEVTAIVFFEKPFLKFERILETYYRNVPKGLFSFLRAMPQWAEKKLMLRREIRRELKRIDPTYKKQKPLLFSTHHLSHAASAFYPSPFSEAAILTIDAVGEWATASIGKGQGSRIELLKEMVFPNSLGLLYSSFTYFLGFKVNEGEYKLMGLAPYGLPHAAETERFIHIIKKDLVEIFADGSIRINRKYFRFESGLRMVPDKKWATLFGINKRAPKAEITQTHCNLAMAIQQVSEEIILKMARTAKTLTQSPYLCLAGGVALNCVANGKLQDRGLFRQIWIQPASGDAGGALGAALAYFYAQHPEAKDTSGTSDTINQAFLGPAITPDEVDAFLKNNSLQPLRFSTVQQRDQYVIREVLAGKVIGWIQGRMEFGPRALGARSIIANASLPDMQQKLNLSIKFREDFRPFAPVMLREEAEKYYGVSQAGSYMQFVHQLLPEYRFELPSGYDGLPIREKLNTPRSKFQAVTHVDFSSRLQIVEEENHPFYSLLQEMRRQSGDGILVNTSFNTAGEPIVCTLHDAYHCFIHTNMDILVVGNYAFTKCRVNKIV
ncbi:MAG: carbamoyltransferase N-terminal domain-containing protein [Saprospiraceae bacterium]